MGDDDDEVSPRGLAFVVPIAASTADAATAAAAVDAAAAGEAASRVQAAVVACTAASPTSSVRTPSINASSASEISPFLRCNSDLRIVVSQSPSKFPSKRPSIFWAKSKRSFSTNFEKIPRSKSRSAKRNFSG